MIQAMFTFNGQGSKALEIPSTETTLKEFVDDKIDDFCVGFGAAAESCDVGILSGGEVYGYSDSGDMSMATVLSNAGEGSELDVVHLQRLVEVSLFHTTANNRELIFCDKLVVDIRDRFKDLQDQIHIYEKGCHEVSLGANNIRQGKSFFEPTDQMLALKKLYKWKLHIVGNVPQTSALKIPCCRDMQPVSNQSEPREVNTRARPERKGLAKRRWRDMHPPDPYMTWAQLSNPMYFDAK